MNLLCNLRPILGLEHANDLILTIQALQSQREKTSTSFQCDCYIDVIRQYLTHWNIGTMQEKYFFRRCKGWQGMYLRCQQLMQVLRENSAYQGGSLRSIVIVSLRVPFEI